MAGLSKRKTSKEKTLLWERRSDAIRVEEGGRVLFWSYNGAGVGVFGGYLSILSVTS